MLRNEPLVYEAIYGYIRVSTLEQVKHGTSLKQQQEEIKKMCLYKFDREPDEYFIDDGVSGTLDFNLRPQGAKLLNMLEPNDVVLCSRLDRLIRSLMLLCTIREDFQDSNIHLFARDIMGGTDSISTSQSPNMKMFVSMMGTFAEWDRDNTVAKLYSGKINAMNEGRYIGGGVPYGYTTKTIGQKSYMVPNEGQQEIMSWIDVYYARMLKQGKTQPWRKMSKQIQSLYETEIPPWKCKRIAERKLKERPSLKDIDAGEDISFRLSQ